MEPTPNLILSVPLDTWKCILEYTKPRQIWAISFSQDSTVYPPTVEKVIRDLIGEDPNPFTRSEVFVETVNGSETIVNNRYVVWRLESINVCAFSAWDKKGYGFTTRIDTKSIIRINKNKFEPLGNAPFFLSKESAEKYIEKIKGDYYGLVFNVKVHSLLK
jgi:hypothetical protein